MTAVDPTPASTPGRPARTHFVRNLSVFLTLLALAFGSFYYLAKRAPRIDGAECEGVSLSKVVMGPLPTYLGGGGDLIGSVKGAWGCAELYRGENAEFVLATWIFVYVTLQSLAIPGPLVLSILAGALYNSIVAQVLIALSATAGASICYMISYYIGNDILQRVAPEALQKFRDRIAANKDNLIYYMLFLRITPLLPNWFVNIASPLVGVPYSTYALATLFGQAPSNYCHVQTGAALSSLTSLSFKDNARVFVMLFVLQFVVLIPTFASKWLKKYEEAAFDKATKAKKLA